jgi:DNA-binding response OmpR family regulator
MRILVVEDETKMARLLKRGLEEEQHFVTVASAGHEALELSQVYSFDVVVLDIMLPGMDGYDVVRRLRQAKNRVPVLMLTARDAIPDIVKGLDVGADDYLTKPFAFDVLLARIRALARRGPAEQLPQLRIADLVLDTATHHVWRGSGQIYLTRTEYLLLEFFMRNCRRVLSRSTIIEGVWGFESSIENNTLDAFVRLLRNKVDDGQKVRLIQTIRGFGYALQEEKQQ